MDICHAQTLLLNHAIRHEGDRMIDLYTAKQIIRQKETADALRDYQYIMNAFRSMDISRNSYFREVFCRHYEMKKLYSEDFRDHYFEIMEQMKEKRKVSFKDCFERVMGIGNRRELSFSSRILHTLDPQYPIWDRVIVEGHFQMKKPMGGKDPVGNYSRRYGEYTDLFNKYMKSEEGSILIRLFDEQFPGSKISDVRKLELILRQDRQNN